MVARIPAVVALKVIDSPLKSQICCEEGKSVTEKNKTTTISQEFKGNEISNLLSGDWDFVSSSDPLSSLDSVRIEGDKKMSSNE